MQSRKRVLYLISMLAAVSLGCAHDVTSNARTAAEASVPITMAIDAPDVGPGARFDKVYRYGDDSLSEELSLHWKGADAIEFTVRTVNRRTGASFSYTGTGLAEGSSGDRAFLSEEGSDVGSVRISFEGESYARVAIIPPENRSAVTVLASGARLSVVR